MESWFIVMGTIICLFLDILQIKQKLVQAICIKNSQVREKNYQDSNGFTSIVKIIS